jgi:hypothetical protein
VVPSKFKNFIFCDEPLWLAHQTKHSDTFQTPQLKEHSLLTYEHISPNILSPMWVPRWQHWTKHLGTKWGAIGNMLKNTFETSGTCWEPIGNNKIQKTPAAPAPFQRPRLMSGAWIVRRECKWQCTIEKLANGFSLLLADVRAGHRLIACLKRVQQQNIRVLCKVVRSGDENGQFWRNSASNA